MKRRLRYLWFEFRRLPVGAFFRFVVHLAWSTAAMNLRRTLPGLFHRATPEAEIVRAFGARNRNDALRAIRDRAAPAFFTPTEKAPALVERFRERFPAQVTRIVEAADRALKHEFDLLGSGPVNLGDPIDWHRDFKTGFVFPRVHHSRVPVYGLPGGADIKVPWELARCQHLVPMGLAYWLTGNEDYAREIRYQIISFIRDNPPGIGCNWACSMEVGLRAANWAWAYYLIRYSSACDDEFLLLFFRSLCDHGRHIRANLEKTPAFAGNHYASDLLGLAYLGTLFPELPEAKPWRAFALAELETQVRRQTYPDGVNFEASVPYHRLATELFLLPYLLFRANGTEPSPEYAARLRGMIDYSRHVTATSGGAPTIGDCDDGRVHVPLPLAINDHAYLAAIGARLFQHSDWLPDNEGANAAAFWYMAGLDLYDGHVEEPEEFHLAGSKSFAAGGVYAMRRGDVCLVCDAGGVGQEGRGGHAHNDALSVVLAVGDTWVLRDPGTGVYTADAATRERFRSTAMHNTVQLDGLEQGGTIPGVLFLLGDDARPTVTAWESGPRRDRLEAHHDGYPGTRVTREIVFDRELGFFKITDRIVGKGPHAFRLPWHFGDVEPAFFKGAAAMLPLLGGAFYAKGEEAIAPKLREDLCRLIEYPEFRVSLLFFGPEGTELTTGRYEFSPSYGVFERGTEIVYAGAFENETVLTTLILIEL